MLRKYSIFAIDLSDHDALSKVQGLLHALRNAFTLTLSYDQSIDNSFNRVLFSFIQHRHVFNRNQFSVYPQASEAGASSGIDQIFMLAFTIDQ